ncbi:MAG TPA: hypothetical protein VK194_04085, partial [Candidatus Deferrimicrobium sp.]|nr:hypothetical protein [Candidatus Deferrimicrobium sp.]
MDWIFVGFVGLLAIALAIAVGIALDRERALEAARAAIARSSLGSATPESGGAVSGPAGRAARPFATPGGDASADLPTLVRRLRDRLDASEFELDQQVRNASYLADLMGVGIIRL